AIADAFTLKQAKLGGIWPTLQAIHQISVVDKIPWIGGMLSSGVGRAVDLALASLPATRQVPADSSSASRYFERDIVLAQPEIVAGQLPVPSDPGLGVTIDWSAVADLQVADTITIK
ncbi:MAG: enolase C-terminal domain-like protein, partial [Weissella cibaria]